MTTGPNQGCTHPNSSLALAKVPPAARPTNASPADQGGLVVGHIKSIGGTQVSARRDHAGSPPRPFEVSPTIGVSDGFSITGKTWLARAVERIGPILGSYADRTPRSGGGCSTDGGWSRLICWRLRTSTRPRVVAVYRRVRCAIGVRHVRPPHCFGRPERHNLLAVVIRHSWATRHPLIRISGERRQVPVGPRVESCPPRHPEH